MLKKTNQFYSEFYTEKGFDASSLERYEGHSQYPDCDQE